MPTHASSTTTDFARCGEKSGLVIHYMCLDNPPFRATIDCQACLDDIAAEQAGDNQPPRGDLDPH